jgi:2-phosphosulfolactate phosphatase
MPSLEICFSPDLLHLYTLENKKVVVADILRATSCMVTGLACGVKSFTPYADLEECRQMRQKGYLIAAERDGQTIDGFDLGNSPFSYMSDEVAGKKVAFTTTNGTQAIQKSGKGEILIGSFLNLQAVTDFLNASGEDVVVVCAGWKGRFNLEDTLFAGALSMNLVNYSINDDAALAAKYLYSISKNNLFQFLSNSSHFSRLKKLNIQKDIEFCLSLNQYSNLPKVINGIVTNNYEGNNPL